MCEEKEGKKKKKHEGDTRASIACGGSPLLRERVGRKKSLKNYSVGAKRDGASSDNVRKKALIFQLVKGVQQRTEYNFPQYYICYIKMVSFEA